MSTPLILAVDRTWTPDRWIDAETALYVLSRGIVETSFGETALTLRGGTNARTGMRSILEVGSILVVNSHGKRWIDPMYAPAVSRDLLFKRDRHVCAYCGDRFKSSGLSMDHVHPESKGGHSDWTNLVTACKPCNQRKADCTPEQARMKLLYVPYKPNRFEALILQNRNILADQMEFLLARVPKHSRLHGA